jgi:hypothetical protein
MAKNHSPMTTKVEDRPDSVTGVFSQVASYFGKRRQTVVITETASNAWNLWICR